MNICLRREHWDLSKRRLDDKNKACGPGKSPFGTAFLGSIQENNEN